MQPKRSTKRREEQPDRPATSRSDGAFWETGSVFNSGGTEFAGGTEGMREGERGAQFDRKSRRIKGFRGRNGRGQGHGEGGGARQIGKFRKRTV